MSAAEFDHLVLQNSEVLRPFAISLTRDNEDARDLYQETLFKAFANRNKFGAGTNIKAWLYTIMRNIFINEYRRKSKRYVVTKEINSDYPVIESSAYSFNNAESGTLLNEIRKKINSLPVVFKKPLNLYFEGYKYHEIARAMDEPLGTIKSRIHFARKLLKEQIERN